MIMGVLAEVLIMLGKTNFGVDNAKLDMVAHYAINVQKIMEKLENIIASLVIIFKVLVEAFLVYLHL